MSNTQPPIPRFESYWTQVWVKRRRTQWDRQPQLPHSMFTCFNKCNVFSHRQNNSLFYSSTLVLHLLSTLNPNPTHPAAWWMTENMKYHGLCRSDIASNLFSFGWLVAFFLLFFLQCVVLSVSSVFGQLIKHAWLQRMNL